MDLRNIYTAKYPKLTGGPDMGLKKEKDVKMTHRFLAGPAE